VTRDIIDLLETVLVSKFAQLSREEIQAMFLLSDIKQTRVYQEAKQEGRQEGRQEGERAGEVRLMLRLLSKRLGKIGDRRLQLINSLTPEQLDDLGETLMDFSEFVDLDNWLSFRIGE
jgi:predicted transposase YdaD